MDMDLVTTALPHLVLLTLGVFNSEILSVLKKVSFYIDGLSAPVKQVVLALFGYVSLLLSHKLGFPLPATPEGVTPNVVSSVLVAAVSMGWFNLKQTLVKK
jgi:hypothetical protein